MSILGDNCKRLTLIPYRSANQLSVGLSLIWVNAKLVRCCSTEQKMTDHMARDIDAYKLIIDGRPFIFHKDRNLILNQEFRFWAIKIQISRRTERRNQQPQKIHSNRKDIKLLHFLCISVFERKLTALIYNHYTNHS